VISKKGPSIVARIFKKSLVVPGGHGVYPEHEGEEEVYGEITHQDAGQGQQAQAYTQVPTDKSSVYFSSSYNSNKYSRPWQVQDSGSTHNS